MRRDWKPALEKRKRDKAGVIQSHDGEPTIIPLHRWENDKALHGQLWNGCCDCGLEHLLAFEIFRDAQGKFWLSKRAYRAPGTEGER